MAKHRFLDGLRLATRDEIAEAIADGGAIGGAIFAASPADIPAIIVFKILHEQFGRPGPGGDPAKSFWEWNLKSAHGVLSVYDWKGGWSIGYIEQGGPSPDLLEDARRLRHDLLQLGRRRTPSATSAVGGVITNPYRIFSDMADSLLEQVADLKRDTEQQVRAYREASERRRPASRRAPKDGT